MLVALSARGTKAILLAVSAGAVVADVETYGAEAGLDCADEALADLAPRRLGVSVLSIRDEVGAVREGVRAQLVHLELSLARDRAIKAGRVVVVAPAAERAARADRAGARRTCCCGGWAWRRRGAGGC